MSTYGNITAPALSRLFCRENHVQYRYDGTLGNFDDASELTRYSGGRHAEIMVPTSWSMQFRGGPASPDRSWTPVNELSASMQTWHPGTGAFLNQYGEYIYSSPGLASTTIPTPISTATNMPLCPTNFTGSATGADCWVMRKGVWEVDVSLDISGTGAYTGPWQFSVYAKAFRDYTLYPTFRDQLVYTTSITGYAVHEPISLASPLEVVLRHNALWDLTFDLTPDAYTVPSIILLLSFHAIRTGP